MLYVWYSTGNSLGPWFSVCISEVSVIGGVHYRRFHCISKITCVIYTIIILKTTLRENGFLGGNVGEILQVFSLELTLNSQSYHSRLCHSTPKICRRT